MELEEAIGEGAEVPSTRSNLSFVLHVLVACSVGLVGCGGDVPRSTLPAPEYERPIVAPWLINADAGRLAQPVALSEDAGGGSENSD